MSKLQELIKELCPEGVEWNSLDNLGSFYGGLTGKNKDDFKDGNAKYITYTNVYSNSSVDLNIETLVKVSEGESQNSIKYGDIIFTGSSETPDECGMSSVVTEDINEKIYLNSFCFGYRLNDTEIYNPHFLKHLFRSSELRKLISKTASGVTRFNVSKKRFGNIEIPLPPLEVQNEIVRILDTFTSHAAELQAELQARKEQYEYYRNKLLTFDENDERVKWIKLGEIGNVCSGKNKDKNPIGTYPVYGSTGIIAYTENYSYCDERILIARVGANAGYTHVAFGKYDVSDNTLIVDLKEGVNLKYVYYTLVNINLNKYAKGGGQPLITAGEIKTIQIPIPSLSEQQRIVSILDKFESLVNDLTAGLPAEIAAVQEQYEYYRNKLLTFKRIS